MIHRKKKIRDDAGVAMQSKVKARASQPDTNTLPTSAESPTPNPTDWNLTLVGARNGISSGYGITATKLKNGHSVDECCYLDL